MKLSLLLGREDTQQPLDTLFLNGLALSGQRESQRSYGQMDQPAVLRIWGALDELSLCQQVNGLGDLRFGQPPEKGNIPGSIAGRIIGQKQQHMDLPDTKIGAIQKPFKLSVKEFLKLPDKLEQAGIVHKTTPNCFEVNSFKKNYITIAHIRIYVKQTKCDPISH